MVRPTKFNKAVFSISHLFGFNPVFVHEIGSDKSDLVMSVNDLENKTKVTKT